MDKNLEKILKAFANRRRLQIVIYIIKVEEASVGEIASSIKLSFKATSKHLSILTSADILERNQRGPHMFYKLCNDSPSAAGAIIRLL